MRKVLLAYILFSLSLGICLSPSSLTACVLDENFNMESLKGKRVGYYIGSFDPIHLGHQRVINSALQDGHVDYVLIYPAPGGDSFKNRNELPIRQKMIASVYQENPRVLLTHWTPKALQDNFSKISEDLEIISIIGSDVITEKLMGPDRTLSDKYQKVFMRGISLDEKHYEDTVGALMALKADSFLVALRGDLNLSHLNGKVHDRPIRAFIQSVETSSTEVRKAISAKQPFEHLLAFSVQALAKQEGLYGFSSKFNGVLQKELLQMQEEDQTARMKILSVKNPSDEEWKIVAAIDERHEQRLRDIIKQHGWPGVSLVGLEGASAMWLLVQHQDSALDFQMECLELLKSAVEAYEASISNLAYLVDRVNMNSNRPQIYGTQWKQEEGKFILYAVEDIVNLDARRASAGLCSIAEYKEAMKAAYHLTDEDFKL